MTHEATYGYLKPRAVDEGPMQRLRTAAKVYGDILESELPDGADKTFTIRNHRTTAMWALVALTRNVDGSPR